MKYSWLSAGVPRDNADQLPEPTESQHSEGNALSFNPDIHLVNNVCVNA
jgi:hypothetical protein